MLFSEIILMELEDHQDKDRGSTLAVQWLGLHAFTAVGLSSIPGQGTKILQAEHSKPKNKKQKKQKIRVESRIQSITYDMVSVFFQSKNSHQKD